MFLRDIRRAEPDVIAARDAVVALSPDIIVLLDMDYDLNATALTEFAGLLADAGLNLTHHIAPRPNTGMATGLDLDGDGRRGTADDAQGWARFAGAGGIALLSRWPFAAQSLRDHTAFLWLDLPGTQLPMRDGQPFPSAAVYDVQRLSSTGAWEVTALTPEVPLTIMTWHAGPPVFGGAEGINRLRNAAENAFWVQRLSGVFGPTPDGPFVLLGDANLDPIGGDGIHPQITQLLSHPSLQDPHPRATIPPPNVPDDATAHWPDGPGALRVEYLLPSRDLQVLNSGLIWPNEDSTHAMLWADLAWPPP